VVAENTFISSQCQKVQIFSGSTVTPMKDSNNIWFICLRASCHCEDILAVLKIVDGGAEI
jgi:hypothetical protein